MGKSFLGSLVNSLSLATPLLFELDESAFFPFCSLVLSYFGNSFSVVSSSFSFLAGSGD